MRAAEGCVPQYKYEYDLVVQGYIYPFILVDMPGASITPRGGIFTGYIVLGQDRFIYKGLFLWVGGSCETLKKTEYFVFVDLGII